MVVLPHVPEAQRHPQHDGQQQEFGQFQNYHVKVLKIGQEEL